MLFLKYKVFLFIYLIFDHGNSKETNRVNFFNSLSKAYGVLNKPEENLNYRDCLAIGYPRNKTTCHCTIHYPRIINLLSNTDGFWYRERDYLPCTDDYPNPNANVHYTTGTMSITGTCNRPREMLEFFHTCSEGVYPRNDAVCHCSFNYPKTVYLKCHSNAWYIENFLQQCKDSGKTCEKPEELINIFHSCEEKIYPVETTSCFCTFNYPTKIHFVCKYWSSTGNIWVRDGVETPCKYNFNPRFVHCYKQNKEIICMCKKNCYSLDIKANLSFEEIDQLCNKNSYYNKDAQMNVYYDSNDKSLQFQCENEYKLIGRNKLTCDYGILSGDLPKCQKTLNNENKIDTEFYIYKILTFALSGLLSLCVLVALSVVFMYLFCRNKNQKESSNNKNINPNNCNVSARDSEIYEVM